MREHLALLIAGLAIALCAAGESGGSGGHRIAVANGDGVKAVRRSASLGLTANAAARYGITGSTTCDARAAS